MCCLQSNDVALIAVELIGYVGAKIGRRERASAGQFAIVVPGRRVFDDMPYRAALLIEIKRCGVGARVSPKDLHQLLMRLTPELLLLKRVLDDREHRDEPMPHHIKERIADACGSPCAHSRLAIVAALPLVEVGANQRLGGCLDRRRQPGQGKRISIICSHFYFHSFSSIELVPVRFGNPREIVRQDKGLPLHHWASPVGFVSLSSNAPLPRTSSWSRRSSMLASGTNRSTTASRM